MAKSRKNIKSMVKSFSNKALPIVNTGLKKTGVAAKKVAIASQHILEKGVSTIYGTIASGINLGVKTISKGIKSSKKMNKKTKKNRRR